MQLELLERFLASDDFRVVASAGPAQVAAEVDALDPHVVLLDLNMPGLSKDGLPALVGTLAGGRARVILFSAADTSALRRLVQSTGAHGYISKSESLADLGDKLRAIRQAAEPANR